MFSSQERSADGGGPSKAINQGCTGGLAVEIEEGIAIEWSTQGDQMEAKRRRGRSRGSREIGVKGGDAGCTLRGRDGCCCCHRKARRIEGRKNATQNSNGGEKRTRGEKDRCVFEIR